LKETRNANGTNDTTLICVPLFNQKKRARVPLTSAPPANEPFSFNNTVAPYRAAGIQVLSGHTSIIKVQYLQSSRYTSTVRTWICYRDPVLRLLCHQMVLEQQKSDNKSEQTNYSVGQNDPGVGVYSGFNQYQPPRNNPSGPASLPRSSQMCQQQMSYKPPNATFKFSQQSTLRSPPVQARTHRTPLIQSTQKPTQPTPLKNTGASLETKFHIYLRYLVSVGLGCIILCIAIAIRSSFFTYNNCELCNLFSFSATLDSAVTLGPHGAKRFIVRDGKEFVQCVYYENEKELPRLIRGQVHRCVGNYDRIRNVLVCVSIRPALPSEQRNAQEAVRVCDAEMRALVKTLSEV
uniref:Uncharacterized protein n=1 Tax=Periophthalmus magnuspinnatus TaxID=409849 RepID=A0A3B4AYG1_9GOBI